MCHKHDKSCLCLTISHHSPVLTIDVIEHRSACLATPENILGLTGDNIVIFHNDGLTIMNLVPMFYGSKLCLTDGQVQENKTNLEYPNPAFL